MIAANDTKTIRVAIADDESDVRVLLRIQLQRAGFDIVGEAADGQEAVDLCVEETPDVVVLDLLMPGTNGFEAIPPMRRQCPSVAIIAYTAVAGEFVRQEMARLRIPLLLKSGNVDALADKIRELAS